MEGYARVFIPARLQKDRCARLRPVIRCLRRRSQRLAGSVFPRPCPWCAYARRVLIPETYQPFPVEFDTAGRDAHARLRAPRTISVSQLTRRHMSQVAALPVSPPALFLFAIHYRHPGAGRDPCLRQTWNSNECTTMDPSLWLKFILSAPLGPRRAGGTRQKLRIKAPKLCCDAIYT